MVPAPQSHLLHTIAPENILTEPIITSPYWLDQQHHQYQSWISQDLLALYKVISH